MRAQRIVRYERLRDQVRPLLLDTMINMRAVVAVRESVKSSLDERGHVVGDEVTAKLVAFVHDGPELAGVGYPRKSIRIAQAVGIDPVLPGQRVDFPHGRAPLFGRQSILAGVAVGS